MPIMKNRFITLIAAAAVAIISSVPSFAQAKIDKLVSSLEKDPEVQVTYTERRDPQTKKIPRQSLILTGTRKFTGETLWNAFEQERPNSVSVTKQRESFIIKFQDKNYRSSYVLSLSGKSWSLVITKRGIDEDGDDWSWSYNSDFNSLDGLDLSDLDLNSDFSDLSRLGSLGTLNDLDDKISNGSVSVYDNNGNLIYKSSSTSSSSKSDKSKKAQSQSKSKSVAKSSKINSRKTRTVTTTSSDGTIVTTSYTI